MTDITETEDQDSLVTKEDQGDISQADHNLALIVEELDEVARQALVEALLFANGAPLTAARISEVTHISLEQVKDILESLKMKCSLEESGIELFEFEGKYQLRSKPNFGAFIQQLKSSRPKKLSQQALETLAIVAYRQPIVKSDIEVIRGVDATPTLKTLIDRGFIKIVGHQASIGQPALYGTTSRFLEVFGLTSLEQLPTLRDLKELERGPSDESTSYEELENNDSQDLESDHEQTEEAYTEQIIEH